MAGCSPWQQDIRNRIKRNEQHARHEARTASPVREWADYPQPRRAIEELWIGFPTFTTREPGHEAQSHPPQRRPRPGSVADPGRHSDDQCPHPSPRPPSPHTQYPTHHPPTPRPPPPPALNARGPLHAPPLTWGCLVPLPPPRMPRPGPQASISPAPDPPRPFL